MIESFRELTNRQHDHLPSYPNVAWRGFAYLDRIVPILPEADGFGDDVESGQRCWVGYLPSADEFLVGYDLWLRRNPGEQQAQMAGGFTRLRLATTGDDLGVTVLANERFSSTVYAKALDVIQARHPDLIEIDID